MSSKEALLSEIRQLRSRGEIKRFAADLSNDSSRRDLFLTLLSDHGHSIEVPIKKGIRLLLERESHSRRRLNPIHVDMPFDCIHCGKSIPPGGGMVRDHCPFCLSGRHVDVTPGDRAAQCRARLKPSSFEVKAGNIWIHYTCVACDHRYRVRAHPDDEIPYSLNVGDLP